jgi:hypothetical protein
MRESSIRFVGGPWHNRIEYVPLYPAAHITGYVGLYRLAEFQTKWGTKYFQYIHSTLIRGQEVAWPAYTEKFPRWSLKRRDYDRLRRCSIWRRSRVTYGTP